MSNIDKQALLKIAESVDREEWDVLDNGDDEYQVIVSGSLERGATYRSYRPVANEIPEQEIAAFIAAANPATVLALLDENIQLQREKDAMEAVALALRDDMQDAREKLEAAGRLIAELDKRLIEYAGIATREARRVAELESRQIALPQRLSPEGYHIDEAYMVDDAEGEYLDRDAVIEAISAAGIQVKGE
ncbi:ead/Ea22-like family protein [Salmonella enterica]